MTDEQIIEAAARALQPDPTREPGRFHRHAAKYAVDAVAPLVRADVLATLRARIEAMPAVNWRAIVDGAPDLLRRDDVLAVIERLTQEGGDQ